MTKRFSITAAIALLFITVFCFSMSLIKKPIAETKTCTENSCGASVSISALPEKILQFMQ